MFVETSLVSVASRVSDSHRRQTTIFDLLVVVLISLILVTAKDKLNAILLEIPFP